MRMKGPGRYFWKVMRDAPLQFEIVPGHVAEVQIVRMTGPLTLFNLFGFQEKIRQIEARLMVLDFEHVPYIDSAGLGAVVNLYVSSQNRGRRLGLVAVSSRVMAIFQQTKVDQVLAFYPNVEAAESAL